MNDIPYTSQYCFAGLDPKSCDVASSRAIITQLPYDATASYKTGSRDGPQSIIQASSQLELFDEELLYEPAIVKIATLAPLEPVVGGPEQMIRSIKEHCLGVVGEDKFVLSLGGEHTVSIGCLDAHIAHFGNDIQVLYLDAHADMRETYQGSRYSHACVARRMLERCNVLSAGLRSFSREEYDILRQKGLLAFTLRAIRNSPHWIDELIDNLGPKVYITLDLDCLDPGICPGVGTPEPGGLSWEQLTKLLRAVFSKRIVIGADVVECLPLPGQHITEFLAARLVYKMIGYRYESEYGTSNPMV